MATNYSRSGKKLPFCASFGKLFPLGLSWFLIIPWRALWTHNSLYWPTLLDAPSHGCVLQPCQFANLFNRDWLAQIFKADGVAAIVLLVTNG